MTPNLDTTFAALADPTRRALLARLAREEATVMELAQPFSMSQPAISRHLKVLEEAGLILRRVDGTRRPCRLAPDGVAAVDQWLDMLRAALTRNYDRLDQVLAEMTPASNPDAKNPKRKTP
jgi:DNA-binding transcriptional ArsR family regulator